MEDDEQAEVTDDEATVSEPPVAPDLADTANDPPEPDQDPPAEVPIEDRDPSEHADNRFDANHRKHVDHWDGPPEE